MPKVNVKKSQAVMLLASGKKAKEAAEDLGVSPETISVWRREPEFEAEINCLRLESLQAARTQLQSLAVEAVSTLQVLMSDAKSDSIRLKACETVLGAAGITDPSTGLWAWGIGKTSAKAVAQQWEDEADPNGAAIRRILDSL